MAGDGVYTFFKPSDPEGVRDRKKLAKLGPTETYTFDGAIKAIALIFGWETKGFDLDASAALFNGDLKCVDFIWWDNLKSSNGAVQFLSNDETGGKAAGDKERIKVDFQAVPDEITHILLTTSVYSKEATLEDVKYVSLKVSDGSAELCNYTVTTDLVGTSMVLGILVRKGTWWSLVTVRQPILARTITEIMDDSGNLDVVKALDASPLVHKRMFVAVRKARNVTDMNNEVFGNKKKCNPCMVITHKGKRYESDVVTNSRNPEFAMEPIDLGEATLSDANILEVQCFHKEEGEEDVWLGVARACVGGLAGRDVGTHEIWLPLGATQQKKERGMNITGTVMLEVTFKNLYPRA